MMERIYLNGDEEFVVEVIELSSTQVLFEYEGQRYRVNRGEGHTYSLNDNVKTCIVSKDITTVDGHDVELESWQLQRSTNDTKAGGDMLSPMPGKILKLVGSPNSQIKAGEPIIVMEAMKMEHTIKASSDGKLGDFLVKTGQLVEGGKELFEFEASES